MKGKFILMLLVLISQTVSANLVTGQKKVIALVFHSHYCEEISGALASYSNAVKEKGYSVVDLCAPTQSVSTLKTEIESKAGEENVRWSDIEGINLIGPVISSQSSSLRLKSQEEPVAELMFDRFTFLYAGSELKDIKSSYFMPSRVRWGSLLFDYQTGLEQVAMKLSEMEERLVFAGEDSCGRRFADELLEELNPLVPHALLNWQRYPDGMGWNIGCFFFILGAWYTMGFNREVEGYSFTNRLQTTGDKLGYIFIIYPSFLFFTIYSGYQITWHLFGGLSNEDLKWKKLILNKTLEIDGLSRF